MSRRAEGHRGERQTPERAGTDRDRLWAQASTPPTPASQRPCLGTPPEPKPCSGELPGTPTSSPHLPEGPLPLPPQGEVAAWRPAAGPRRVGVGGKLRGEGGARRFPGPLGEGPSPWDPDAAGAGPGEMRLLPKPGAPRPTTLCPQCPLCKRVGWQQRPQSPAQRGGPPHVRRAHFLPRAEGGPTQGPGASNPGGMAAPPPSAECQFTTQRARAEISAPLGSPCSLPNQWPHPQISAPAKRTQVSWAPLGAQEKSQPASSHPPPTAWGPCTGAHGSASGSQPQQPL